MFAMKTICIAGATSGLGKTALAVALLSRLHGWSACKVTTCLGGNRHRCPRGHAETCGVCSSLSRDYEIVEEKGEASDRDKDTGRLAAAGARRVLWVKSKPEFLPDALGKALGMLGRSRGILIEGNHALTVVDPDVAVMILPAGVKMKKSARAVLDKIDIFARAAGEEGIVERILAAVRA
jgi:hypothetical protein